ncbi:MAG: hypothetical protein E7440_04270 [Ruminococcaceae bacterium]|nr:hypothetical protein [Oscillospiraceae bacterium]
MKEGTTITKLVMFLLAACLAVYFAVYLFRGMTDPLTTAVAYTYTVNDSVKAEALIVRQEQVLPAGVGIADVTPGEGERVGAGQTVAVLYRDSQALDRKAQIQQLTLEAELLQYATTQTDPGGGVAELEQDVVRAVIALRTDGAAGDFGRLEDRVLDLKRAVLKRDYTYGQGVDPSRLNEISRQLRALQTRSTQDTSRVYAREAGTFSAQVDGYEDITPDAAARLTPLDLDTLLDRGVLSDERALGKIITANRWYLAANLPVDAAERLTLGKTAVVRFTGDFSRDVDMRVDSISQPQDGRCTVLLSSDRYLADTTLLRRQTVEVIFDSDPGLRVPKDAVHILTKTVTDKETGQEQKVSTTGVYALVNGQAEFKKVQVLAEGTQFYVVKPLDEGKRVLRAGNQVIVRAHDLYDGKVVQE